MTQKSFTKSQVVPPGFYPYRISAGGAFLEVEEGAI